MWRFRTESLSLAVLVLAMAAPGAAQQKKPAADAQQQQPAPQAQQQAPGPAMPDAFKLNLLIRSSIIALNQANQTGNYTVLQDLGAPAFRAGNDSARLSQIFAALRQRQLDLSPVLFFTPKLIAQPQINAAGLMRLAGYFPTTPERVNFELIFQMVNNDWRIFGIGVSMSPAEVTAALPPQAEAQPQAAPAPAPAAALRGSQASAPKAAAKPETAPAPGRKPSAQNDRANPPPGKPVAAKGGVQNATTNNAARIDLAPSAGSAQGWSAAESVAAEPAEEAPSFLGNLNPFSGN